MRPETARGNVRGNKRPDLELRVRGSQFIRKFLDINSTEGTNGNREIIEVVKPVIRIGT